MSNYGSGNGGIHGQTSAQKELQKENVALKNKMKEREEFEKNLNYDFARIVGTSKLVKKRMHNVT